MSYICFNKTLPCLGLCFIVSWRTSTAPCVVSHMRTFTLVTWNYHTERYFQNTVTTFPEVIAHYVLIPILGHWERTCYVHCNFFKVNRRCIVAPRPSPPSLDRRTGSIFLVSTLDVFSATDPVKYIPNFRRRLVDSEINTRIPIVHLSKHFLDFGGHNHQQLAIKHDTHL